MLASEHDRLVAYVRRHFPACLSPDFDPYDVVQDTYFAAGCQMSTFRPVDDTSVFRFLATIARRRIAKLLQLRGQIKRGGRSKWAAQTDSVAATLAELAAHRNTPSRSAARHEFLAALERALSGLPAHISQAVRMKHVEGLSESEIAGRTGRTHRAVHQLCYRGLQMIRRELRSASMFV